MLGDIWSPNWQYIPLIYQVYISNWLIICYLPPMKGTRKLHWYGETTTSSPRNVKKTDTTSTGETRGGSETVLTLQSIQQRLVGVVNVFLDGKLPLLKWHMFVEIVACLPHFRWSDICLLKWHHFRRILLWHNICCISGLAKETLRLPAVDIKSSKVSRR